LLAVEVDLLVKKLKAVTERSRVTGFAVILHPPQRQSSPVVP
jgi:hypothetical protein